MRTIACCRRGLLTLKQANILVDYSINYKITCSFFRHTLHSPEPSVSVLRSRIVTPHASLPLLRSAASGDRGIRTPTSVAGPSAQPALGQPLDQSEEDPLPRVPGQHPVDHPSSTPHDLARHPD